MAPQDVTPRTTSHRLTLAEARAVAWMLERTAGRSRTAGYTAAASDFEAGAQSFRGAIRPGGQAVIELTDATIENLTSMAWSLLDEWKADPDTMERAAAQEWARIGDALLAIDGMSGAMSRFLTDCAVPALLPAYTAAVIAELRERAGIESDLAA